jgi:hypothetical protein
MDVKLYLYPEYTDRERERAAIDLGKAADGFYGVEAEIVVGDTNQLAK